MTVLVHDNPATMARECWRDGKLLVSYNHAILRPFAKSDIPADHFAFEANIGPWREGQMVGDPAARREGSGL